jgi:ABC-2 type transport system permease protein
VSRPATFLRAVRSQASMEARLTARRGENVLAMIVIPVVLLLYFATFGTRPEMPSGSSDSVSGLIPGTLAVALVASGLVNLGIATAYERGYGVLKRLGGAPLGRSGLLTAKLGVVLAIGCLQVGAVFLLAGLVLGWSPTEGVSWPDVLLVTLAGSLAFAGLGLLLAGTLRPEATLVVANVAFLAAVLLGDVLPVATLTGRLADLASVLPAGALARAFNGALTGSFDPLGPFAVLVAWAVLAFAAAARTFRWE